MRIVKPNDITLVSSDIEEDQYNDWDSSTSYTAGDRVYVVSQEPHDIYEATQDNTDKFPPDSPNQWALVGPSNRWAMFDGLSTTASTKSGGFTVTVGATGGQLALFGVEANSVDIVTRDSDGTQLSNDSVELRLEDISNWLEYFFDPFRFQRTLFFDLPDNVAESDVTFNSDGTAECSHLIVGDETVIGQTENGVEVGIQDFSRKERNDFGTATLVERASTKTIEGDVILTSDADDVLELLADIRVTPVAWDVNNSTQFDELRLFGFWRDFDVSEETPAFTEMSFDIRGLT